MSLTARTLLKARTATTTVQRRTFIDWMTNYPDKVSTESIDQSIIKKAGRQPFPFIISFLILHTD